jgi:predicted dehydrogenase
VIRAVVAGLGSIGRRHLANLRAIEPDAQITVLRHDRAETAVPADADRVVHTLADAVAQRPDIAFVCGPSSTHVTVGLALAEAGIHLFVEKPLALMAADAARLVDVCAQARRLLIVGYNLRFSTSLRALYDAARSGRIGRIMSGRAEVGQYLPDWRPDVDYRRTNSARREFGGGVVLELSHELDYMRWLLGDVRAVDAVVARLSDLEIDVDDTADILLSFARGSVGNIHLDMTQRNPTRRCQLVGTNGTLSWDGITGETRLFEPGAGWSTLVPAGAQERDAMYLAQTAHVVACLRGEAEPLADGRTGAAVVKLAEAVAAAAREGRRVTV